METAQCLSRLQRLCSRAEYCRSDVRRKALRDLEGNEAAADAVVEALVRERYVDDARYSRAFAREKASLQGWGPVKIRFQLRGKGIADALIDAALEEVDTGSAADKLERLLAARSRQLEGDPQKRLKLLKYALGRGYAYDQVEEALARLRDGANQ
jgi:regulatory protein